MCTPQMLTVQKEYELSDAAANTTLNSALCDANDGDARVLRKRVLVFLLVVIHVLIETEL